MKMMMKDAIVKGNKEAEVTKELETMINIEHPFIVQIHYAFHNQARLFLVVVTSHAIRQSVAWRKVGGKLLVISIFFLTDLL